MKPVCPYCGRTAAFKDSSVIYGRSYGRVWICPGWPGCDSYVGVHRGTRIPLGRMANAELREAKKNAHAVFDGWWKARGMKRSKAYKALAEMLGIRMSDCHIGMFDVQQCCDVLRVINERKETDHGQVAGGLQR